MTMQETGEIMDILAAAYPRFYAAGDRESRRKALALWAAMLKEYPAPLVAAAVKALIASDEKGFPPHVGAVLAQLRTLTAPETPGEQEAWAQVRAAIRRSGYQSEAAFRALPEDVRRVVHDPGQLHTWAVDEHFNEGVVSSNFMRAYRTYAQRQKALQALPEDVRALAKRLAGRLSPPETEDHTHDIAKEKAPSPALSGKDVGR